MRFIHCADLHIGKNQNGSPQRYEDFFDAFEQLKQAAEEAGAAFIIAAGDVFDTRSLNSATLWRMTRILTDLKQKNIPFFAVEGNHDKAFYYERESWLCYLNNLGLITLLKPDYEDNRLVLNPYDGVKGAVYEAEGYRIVGLGYFGAMTKKRLEEALAVMPAKDRFTVVLLHAALQSQMTQDMAGVERECMLALKDFSDYLALGHIHRRYESGDFMYNPGSLEHVDSGEARRKDTKGYYLVEAGEELDVRFCPVTTRQHVFVSVDVSGMGDREVIRKKLFEEVAKTEELRHPVIEAELTGVTPLETYKLDTALLEEELVARFGAISASVSTYLLNAAGEGGDEVKVDRLELEKSVMRQIMKETGYEEGMAEHLSEFALNIKNSVGNGFNSVEIADIAEELAALKAGDAL